MKLRYYQDDAINSLFSYFAEKSGNPILALPTGTGKSVVIAGFCMKVLMQWPNQRILILTHVKELVEQNAAKLKDVWPNAPVGVFSAGLNQRDAKQPIIFGGVASVVNCPEAFGHRDLIFVDECQLVSDNDDTMYNSIFERLKLINPHIKVIGLSATPFRQGLGLLTNGRIFTDVCYDITKLEDFNRLISEGFLCPPIAKNTSVKIDVSGVRISKGDYAENELQKAANKEEVTSAALCEMFEYAHNRKAWLLFASGNEHAENISKMLNSMGRSCEVIHSGVGKKERKARLAAFKAGELASIANNNVLTTGFDYPGLDCIGILRPTLSTVLHVQIIGRGTRPAPDKRNCLVFDFAGNTDRLGPINDPVIPRKKGEGTGEAPIRICEACGCYNHASARFCDNCGQAFEFKVKIVATASNAELLRETIPQVDYFEVTTVIYSKHEKEGKNKCLKVTYFCGMQKFTEWVFFEHDKLRRKAEAWWMQVHNTSTPLTVDEALRHVSELRAPKRIRVWVNKEYPEVLGHEY